jgi:hypothetical protein
VEAIQTRNSDVLLALFLVSAVKVVKVICHVPTQLDASTARLLIRYATVRAPFALTRKLSRNYEKEFRA